MVLGCPGLNKTTGLLTGDMELVRLKINIAPGRMVRSLFAVPAAIKDLSVCRGRWAFSRFSTNMNYNGRTGQAL